MPASDSKKVIYAALAGNLLIAATKFIAAAFTGSSAMLSEGVHSIVDTGNQGLMLYGMRRAGEPADERFPFGYGKEIYFWSFVVALLIFAAGAGISIYEGIRHIWHPGSIENPLLNYIVIGFALLFEGSSWLIAFKQFKAVKGMRGYIEAVRRGKDPTVFSVLFEDTAALLGLVVALIGIFIGDITGNPYFDGTASIVIGLILAATAYWLAYETKGLLIGESANREVVAGIRALVERHAEVHGINEILTMHMGPDFILVNISLNIAGDIDRASAHAVLADIDRAIKEKYPKVKRVFIESQTGSTARHPSEAERNGPSDSAAKEPISPGKIRSRNR
ncbi:MAG: cation transporter [Herminiimonas sp.]|nr:cation transporter [Herminiimonas sp.]